MVWKNLWGGWCLHVCQYGQPSPAREGQPHSHCGELYARLTFICYSSMQPSSAACLSVKLSGPSLGGRLCARRWWGIWRKCVVCPGMAGGEEEAVAYRPTPWNSLLLNLCCIYVQVEMMTLCQAVEGEAGGNQAILMLFGNSDHVCRGDRETVTAILVSNNNHELPSPSLVVRRQSDVPSACAVTGVAPSPWGRHAFYCKQPCSLLPSPTNGE